MLVTHRTIAPSFGLRSRDQEPVGIYTILSINESGRDCAAYRGVGPMEADDAMIERIKAGGDKISEREARSLFGEIEDMGLRYRK